MTKSTFPPNPAADFQRALAIVAAQRNDALNGLVQAQVASANLERRLLDTERELEEAQAALDEARGRPTRRAKRKLPPESAPQAPGEG